MGSRISKMLSNAVAKFSTLHELFGLPEPKSIKAKSRHSRKNLHSLRIPINQHNLESMLPFQVVQETSSQLRIICIPSVLPDILHSTPVHTKLSDTEVLVHNQGKSDFIAAFRRCAQLNDTGIDGEYRCWVYEGIVTAICPVSYKYSKPKDLAVLKNSIIDACTGIDYAVVDLNFNDTVSCITAVRVFGGCYSTKSLAYSYEMDADILTGTCSGVIYPDFREIGRYMKLSSDQHDLYISKGYMPSLEFLRVLKKCTGTCECCPRDWNDFEDDMLESDDYFVSCDNFKMVFVVVSGTLSPAQLACTCVDVALNVYMLTLDSHPEWEESWITFGQTKISLQVDSVHSLEAIRTHATSFELPTYLSDGVLGIGPCPHMLVDLVTGSLPLYVDNYEVVPRPSSVESVVSVTSSLLVLVVRKELNMSPGKVAVQCCHALIMALDTDEDDAIDLWMDSNPQRYCIYQVETLSELHMLAQTGMRHGVGVHIVEDAGRTEVEPGSETVLALGPGEHSLLTNLVASLTQYS